MKTSRGGVVASGRVRGFVGVCAVGRLAKAKGGGGMAIKVGAGALPGCGLS